MGDRKSPTFGILLIDDAFSPDTEADQGSGTTDSSYSEAGPIPGVPSPAVAGSTWRPQIVGAQETSLSCRVIQGGFPGRDGASVLVRTSSEAQSRHWRGWDEPNLVAGWSAPDSGWVGSTTIDRVTACVIPDTQKLVVVGVANTGGTAATWSFDPRTEAWTDGYDWGASEPLLTDPVALAYDDETERVLLFTGAGTAGNKDIVAYSSGDLGVTWSLYARGGWDQTTPSGGRMTVAAPRGRPWCAFRAASTNIDQYVSYDHGVTWTRVVAATTVCTGFQATVVATKSGTLLAIYLDGTAAMRVYRFGAASTAFNSGELVTNVGGMGTGLDSITACVDEDGIVYAFVQNADNIICTRSLDEGQTWEAYDWNLVEDATGTVTPTLEHAVTAAGQVHLLHTIDSGDASLSASFGVFHLGGWSNVEAGVGVTTQHAVRTARMGFGAYTGSATVGASAVMWWPGDHPESMGWTKGGAGATGDLTTTPGLQLTSADAYYSRTWTHQDYTAGEAWIQWVSGGSTSASDIAISVRSANGSQEFVAILRIADGSVSVYDAYATTTTTTAVVTSAGVALRWLMAHTPGSTCRFSAWARPTGATRFTRLVSKQTLTDKGSAFAANDQVIWGHLTGTSATSNWRIVAYSPDADWCSDLDSIPEIDDPSAVTTGYLGLQFGRALPPRSGDAYPVPAAGSTGDCPRIAATGGPTYHGETTTLSAAHERPFSAVYPALNPSPRRYWESTDTTEQKVVWDRSSQVWAGGAIGMVVMGSYARQVELAVDDGGGGWTVAGTLDLSLSAGTALNSTLAGSVVYPRAGSATVGRYIAEGSLVGGYCVLSAGAGFAGRRIIANSGGYWSTSTTTQVVRIQVEGIDGTEDASGTVDIIAPNGVLVVYLTSLIARRRYRVRWAASQVTPGSVYRAGVVGVGRIVGLGAEPGWDWQRSLEMTRSVVRERGGTRHVKQMGPPRQVWSYPFTDGICLHEIRSTTDADYIGISSAQPIGTAEDAWWAWWGHIEQDLRSGEVPCVLLPKLPAATGTITDPSLFVYGSLASEAVSVTGASGTEGTDEVVRLDAPVIEEIR